MWTPDDRIASRRPAGARVHLDDRSRRRGGAARSASCRAEHFRRDGRPPRGGAVHDRRPSRGRRRRRRPSKRRRQGGRTDADAGAAAALESSVVCHRPHVLRDRPEGVRGRHSGRRIRIGSVKPCHRSGARGRSDARRLRPRRQFQYLYASRARRGGSVTLFGLGRQKPHHYFEMAKVAWENRDQLPFAWRILTNGVCDGCALGTSGLSGWTIQATHLCMVRLELMRLNTAPPLTPARLTDVSSLRSCSSAELRALGRLPEPMLRRRGEAGFLVATWDEALDRIAEELRTVDPSRAAFYLTSRGITNEVYYAAQKAARFLGSSHIDNSARLCHAASTSAMRATLGYGASTCSYSDWLNADLIVLFGSNVANNQPVAMKYLHEAKKNGAQIAVVNPYREPGLVRYWVPSIAESALFGTAIADHWFDVDTGGDLAFLVGVLRALIETGGVDDAFVRQRTVGFEAARAAALDADWEALEADSGATRER